MTMEDTKVDVTPSKRSKKLRSTSEASNDSKSEKDVKIVQNGTASSSEISEVESDKDIPKSPKTKKIVKKAKVEQQKEVKNSIKEENNPDSSPSEEDFLGFDDNAPTSNKKDEQRKNFLSFVEELQSTVDTGVSDTEESGVEDGTDREDKEEEEMTVDTAAASDDTDSDQMEIDSKAGEKVKESDVDIMETESNKSGESKVSKKSENEKTDTADKGNTKIEYCGACSAEVDDAEEGICCDGVCERWFHLRCSGLSQLEYNELSMDENAKWACPKCSGKPTPNLSAESKTPKISVRKDLQDTSTPRLASKRKSIVKEGPSKTPKIDISNPAFLKPFDFGWKRELVYRTTDNTAGKRQGDIYYYTPKGKKLRSLREISEHVVGTELTIDNFTFWKEPIGIDDPEKEIIRDAKIKLSNKDGTASPSLPKKVVTPKVTKAAKTTPKLTATVTPIDSTTGAPITPKASASVTPRVVLKGKTSVAASPKVKIVPTKTATPKVAISKDDILRATMKTVTVPVKRLTPGAQNARSTVTRKQIDEDSSSDTSGNNEGSKVKEVEIKKKNRFRRYGLLANCRSSYSSPESSASDSENERLPESRSVKPTRAKIRKKSKSSRKDQRTTHKPQKSSVAKRIQGNSLKTSPRLSDNFSVVGLHMRQSSNHPVTPSLALNKKPPTPPEIQFRPSNPSSYGCQISPSLSTHSPTWGSSSFIQKATTSQTIISPLSVKNTPLKSQSECHLEIKSVQSLRTGQEGIFEFISVAPFSNNNETEVIILDDEEEDTTIKEEDSPPHLKRSSGNIRFSNSHLSPPHLRPEPISSRLQSHSLPQASTSREPCVESELGKKMAKRRALKLKRFQQCLKNKRRLAQLKKSYEKSKILFLEKRAEEAHERARALRLKNDLKEMKKNYEDSFRK